MLTNVTKIIYLLTSSPKRACPRLIITQIIILIYKKIYILYMNDFRILCYNVFPTCQSGRVNKSCVEVL